MLLPPPPPAAIGDMMLTILAISSAVFGLIACGFAVHTRIRLANVRKTAGADCAASAAALAFREALLAGADERVTVLGDGDPFNMAGAHTWFRAAMAGPDAKALAAAVDGLLKSGAAFRIVARSEDGDAISVRGASIAQRSAIYVKRLGPADMALDFRLALDAMPMPVWFRGSDLKLRWANSAFLSAVGASSLKSAIAANAMLDKSEAELAASAHDCAGHIEATRYVSIEGKRRALSLTLTGLPDSTIAGMAVDMTELSKAQAQLQLQADATSDMVNGMPFAVAQFDKDQQLCGYNAAYAGLWSLSEEWLDSRPTLAAILDRLREIRLLPEQQNYPAWKAGQTLLFETCDRAVEDTWHLPDGRSVKILTRPHLMGGLVMVFEDITETLRLEASLKLLTQVQRATLDTVEDGIAIFGPDGRLVLHNKVFARQWLLSENELAEQPPLAKVARLAETRLGPDGLWRIVAAGVTSDEPERCNEWGRATRTDGRIIALAMKRLPNGATAVTFTDLTDVERFQSANREAPHAAA
jgi:PAS domain-containing protein